MPASLQDVLASPSDILASRPDVPGSPPWICTGLPARCSGLSNRCTSLPDNVLLVVVDDEVPDGGQTHGEPVRAQAAWTLLPPRPLQTRRASIRQVRGAIRQVRGINI
jgi:hypothetical protein